MKTAITLAFVIGIGGASGCGSGSTDPDVGFQFESEGLQIPAEASSRPFEVTGLGGGARIEGSFIAPCANYPSLDGDLSVNHGALTLTVSLPSLRVCASMPQTFHYTAHISELEPGAHTVEIRHSGDFERGADEQTVFTGTIQVR